MRKIHPSIIKFAVVVLLVGALAVVLAPTVPGAIAATPEPTKPAADAAKPEPTQAPLIVPHQKEWEESGHADAASPAFGAYAGWAAAEEIPNTCAKCHSNTGFQEYLETGKNTKGAPKGDVVTCVTCHNDKTAAMNEVVLGWTVTVEKDGKMEEMPVSVKGDKVVVCMNCHQGRQSKETIDDAIAKAWADSGKKPEDKIDEDAPIKFKTKDAEGKEIESSLAFQNVHYTPVVIVRYGSQLKGGYEYPGKTYDSYFAHEPGIDKCQDCHDSHTLEVKVDTCKTCHTGVAKAEDLRKVREPSSAEDYDGDGDVKEGMYDEVEGVKAQLWAAIQAYAEEVGKAKITYAEHNYPYFVSDKNGDGKFDDADKNDKGGVIGYPAWTPRLLKAAHNMQIANKDHGAYAHNSKYVIQLMLDSIEDLNTKLSKKVDTSKAVRNDAGHFASGTEAWRHWDAEGEVPAACAKCHSGEGLPTFLKNGSNVAVEPSSGLECATCHDGSKWPERYGVNEVAFPSGKKVSFGEKNDANLCINCHQGRESTVSVDKAIAASTLTDDEVASDTKKLAFRNVHYFAAGATVFGTDAQGGYEYKGKTYAGQFIHTEGKTDTCIACHDAHMLKPDAASCKTCHQTDDVSAIRMTSKEDYDGDGDTKEGIKGEVAGLEEKLLKAIQAYAQKNEAITYDAHAYPYWFGPKNSEGKAAGYTKWTPTLLRAAYNYQYVQKDPGAYVHNPIYTLQILCDSIEGIGGDKCKVRPEAKK